METCILTYEDTRVVNSDLNVFPHTDSLPRQDHSTLSFYLKVTECSLCFGHDSKCRDGTVNKADRVSFMELGDGRWERHWESVIDNKWENKQHNFRQRYNKEVKTPFSLHSAPSSSSPPHPLLMFSNNLLHPVLNRPFPPFVDALIPPPLLSCHFIALVYLFYLSQRAFNPL